MKLVTALLGASLACAGFGANSSQAEAQTPAPQVDPTEPGAESGAQTNVVSYPASFYAPGRPATAVDMLRRTPGFNYSGGNNNTNQAKPARGLSSAAGNVLIDGQAQTSKTVTLDDVLGRIQANQVLRIDIVRAGAGGLDMQGFPVIANVIRVPGGGDTSFVAQIEPRIYSDDGATDGSARVEWSRHAGALSMEGAAEVKQYRLDEAGTGWIHRITPSGAVLGAGVFDADDVTTVGAANGAMEYRTPKTLYRINGGISVLLDKRNEQSFFATPEKFLVDEQSDKGEIGANIEHKISAALVARLDALQTFEEKTRTAGPLGAITNTDSTAGESNLRGALAWRPTAAFGAEIGAEWAFNFLDQTSTLKTTNATVRVEERRAQPFVTINWQAFRRLSLELGARYETSTITQTGGSSAENTFSFLKPRVIGTLDITDSLQFRGRAERVVKQLDFLDFAASSGVNDGGASAGNTGLKPENAWEYEGTVEKTFGKGSTLAFSYEHQEVTDTLDYIAIGATDGRGNIGKSTREEYSIDARVPLDRFGIRGGRIDFSPNYFSSKTVDPFTGAERQITGNSHFRGRLTFYLDRPEWHSTFTFEQRTGFRERSWRRSQFQTVLQDPLSLFTWDWTPRPSLTVRTTVTAVANRQRWWTRDIYSGDRRTAPIAYREVRYTEQRPYVSVRLRKEF